MGFKSGIGHKWGVYGTPLQRVARRQVDGAESLNSDTDVSGKLEFL
jgi:hypothetical protein